MAEDQIVIYAGSFDKQIYLPVVLAQRLGYFDQQGLKVELVSEQFGVDARDALIADAAQAVAGPFSQVLYLRSRRQAVESVVQLGLAPGDALLVSSKLAADIPTPKSLKGRRIGITGFGSATSLLTRYIAKHYGLSETDVHYIPIGSGAGFIQAMKQGRIDAGIMTEPTATRILESGLGKIMLDLRTPGDVQKFIGDSYPYTCLYLKTSWVQTHPVETQKLVNAVVLALAFIKAHSASEIGNLIPGTYLFGDKAVYLKALNAIKPQFSTDGLMPENGARKVASVFRELGDNAQSSAIGFDTAYTNVFVRAAHK